jgi:trimeric autotransporter adhesin
MHYGLDLIRKLKPAVFKFRNTDNKKHFGLMAQEINDVLDEHDFAIVFKGADGYYRVNYIEFIAPIIKAIQELDQRINKLERISDE